jgi:hypothetical protein
LTHIYLIFGTEQTARLLVIDKKSGGMFQPYKSAIQQALANHSRLSLGDVINKGLIE